MGSQHMPGTATSMWGTAPQTSGTAGHSVEQHNGMQFSTRDRDNDKGSDNCAVRWNANGWWFNNCYNVALNGPYICGQVQSDWIGIIWYKFKGRQQSLKFTEMKLSF